MGSLKYPFVYIAGPFFNPAQIAVIEDIKKTLDLVNVRYFSPKDECLYQPGVTTPAQVLAENIHALKDTDLLLCVTDGKDPGTMFEAGWCYANTIPIIYIWLDGQPGQKFNLVLAASGSVVRSMRQLSQALADVLTTGEFVLKNWDEQEVHYE